MYDKNMKEENVKQESIDEYINECIKETEKKYGWIKKIDDEKFNQLWENINKTFSVFHG